jgi:8-oxo-dGTP pyrophosphatase MutT (NUDIX family)
MEPRLEPPPKRINNPGVGRFTDKALRVALTAAHSLLRLGWLARRPRTFGAHAFALTPERKVILVRLRYAPGWRLPGGGRGEREDPRDAILRELREEIGMTSHGRVRLAAELEQQPYFKRDLASLLIVEDVRYEPPRWSWEVERIAECAIDDLPKDMAPIAAAWVAALRDRI